MGKVREGILKVLEGKDLSVREIAKEVRKTTGMAAGIPQIYNELYLLEAQGKVKRKEWFGCWIWSKT
jgi:Fe2+ or Zn2+ uptake regulation protein